MDMYSCIYQILLSLMGVICILIFLSYLKMREIVRFIKEYKSKERNFVSGKEEREGVDLQEVKKLFEGVLNTKMKELGMDEKFSQLINRIGNIENSIDGLKGEVKSLGEGISKNREKGPSSKMTNEVEYEKFKEVGKGKFESIEDITDAINNKKDFNEILENIDSSKWEVVGKNETYKIFLLKRKKENEYYLFPLLSCKVSDSGTLDMVRKLLPSEFEEKGNEIKSLFFQEENDFFETKENKIVRVKKPIKIN